MSGDKITRPHRITIRFSDSELNILNTLRDQEILSEYIRKTLLGEKYVKKELLSSSNYNTIHKHNLRNNGKATRCVNYYCEKKSNKFQWALIHGRKYSKNINDYYSLCVKCHKRYDLNKICIVALENLTKS